MILSIWTVWESLIHCHKIETLRERESMKLLNTCLIIPIFFLIFSVSGCSSNPSSTADNKHINNHIKTETGTVLAVKSIYIKPETLRPNVGVSIGSGGYRGVHGGFDVGNVARVIRDANKPRFKQDITIRKTNGETIAISQISRELFKQGDQVKLILISTGEARVIH